MTASQDSYQVILIAGLSGYTALGLASGRTPPTRTMDRFVSMVREFLTPRTVLAGTFGDEAFLLSDDATSAVDIALRLRRGVASEASFPAMRAGIHAGLVVEREGRYSGLSINLASQVASYARGSEILATTEVAEKLREQHRDSCRPLGGVRFEGIAEPVSIYAINDMGNADESSALDPVCQMPVKRHAALTCLHYLGGNYFFCSLECAQTFAARPERYAGHATWK